MANLSAVPKTVWIAGAGALALVGGGSIPDKQTRLLVRTAGGIALAASFFMGLDDIMDFFGLKTPPKIIEDTSSPLPEINTGAPGSTGIVAGYILSPVENETLTESADTYQVKIRLVNSRGTDTLCHVTLESEEVYSFGQTAKEVTDVGSIILSLGEQRDMTINVRTANHGGFTNPFFPPEVSLSLRIDGDYRDVVRFKYE